MATATTPFSVWINVLGSVSPSVTNSLNSVNRQLKGLQTQVLATSRAMQFGFGRLLGFGLGLAGIGGVVAGMKQAIDLSLQNEQIQEATLVILRNQRQLRHENSQLAIQDLKALNEQAISLQRQTGLYKNVFERGSLILAQSRLNLNQIESLQPVMANLLAAQRMQGKSAEDMQQTYKAIGMAIERGMGRSLSRSGVLLTPIEQRMLMMNAMVGNIAGNLKIVENAINRTYAGVAKFRMETLTGRTEAHLADMRMSLEHMGDALKPIWQRLVGISARLISSVEPVIVRLANLIGGALKNHMKDIAGWIDLLRTRAIPTMVDWINKGWLKLMMVVAWFRKNQVWIVGWATLIIDMFRQVGTVTMSIFRMINPQFKYVVDQMAAISMGIVAAMHNVRSLKNLLTNFNEWLWGTKRLDPHNQGWGYTKKYPKGTTPKALPVYSGWFGNMVDELIRLIDKWWLKFTRWLNKAFNQLRDGIIKWFGQMWDWIQGQINVWVPALERALERIWKAIDQFLLHPIKTVSDLWEKFLKSTGLGSTAWQTQGPEQPSGPTLPGGGGNRDVPNAYNPLRPSPLKAGAAGVGPYRVFEQYPWEGHAANYGPTGAYLGVPNEIGLGANLQAKYGVRPGRNDWVQVRVGNWTAWRKVMETSERPSGVEFWSPRQNQYLQYGEKAEILNVSHGGPGGVAKKDGGQNITLNYNVTHHHHGGEGYDEHRMAAIHRRHIDQLHRDLAEVEYRRNRSAFDGARAV